MFIMTLTLSTEVALLFQCSGLLNSGVAAFLGIVTALLCNSGKQKGPNITYSSFTHKFSMHSCTEKHYNFKYFLNESWRNCDEFLL